MVGRPVVIVYCIGLTVQARKVNFEWSDEEVGVVCSNVESHCSIFVVTVLSSNKDFSEQFQKTFFCLIVSTHT